MITSSDVTKRYPDGTVAVDGLTLDVPDGTLAVFVGPSGCGKTTSMRMINRMIEPTSGTLTVDGRDVTKVDPVKLRLGIGYVIQSAGLMPHLRVVDNVATVPVLKGESRRAARKHHVRFIPEEPLHNACAPKMTVAENLSFRTFDVKPDGHDARWINGGRIRRYAAGLVSAFKVKTASLSSPISSLSGGNVQRAVLARELTGEVDLLIVSNPCFGLDFSAVAEIRSRIMKARNGGAAVLLLSEDLDELFELSDRILVMSGGELVYETPIATADIAVIGAHMAGHH